MVIDGTADIAPPCDRGQTAVRSTRVPCSSSVARRRGVRGGRTARPTCSPGLARSTTPALSASCSPVMPRPAPSMTPCDHERWNVRATFHAASWHGAIVRSPTRRELTETGAKDVLDTAVRARRSAMSDNIDRLDFEARGSASTSPSRRSQARCGARTPPSAQLRIVSGDPAAARGTSAKHGRDRRPPDDAEVLTLYAESEVGHDLAGSGECSTIPRSADAQRAFPREPSRPVEGSSRSGPAPSAPRSSSLGVRVTRRSAPRRLDESFDHSTRRRPTLLLIRISFGRYDRLLERLGALAATRRLPVAPDAAPFTTALVDAVSARGRPCAVRADSSGVLPATLDLRAADCTVTDPADVDGTQSELLPATANSTILRG